MSSSDARMRILNKIAEGHLSAEKGARLLENLAGTPASTAPPRTPPPAREMVVFRIINQQTGETLVNLRLPISLVSTAQKLGAKIASNIEGFNLQEILDDLRSGEAGQVFRIEKNHEIIEIIVE
jgi:hypothetical protein